MPEETSLDYKKMLKMSNHVDSFFVVVDEPMSMRGMVMFGEGCLPFRFALVSQGQQSITGLVTATEPHMLCTDDRKNIWTLTPAQYRKLINDVKLVYAFRTARYARFEHGANGR